VPLSRQEMEACGDGETVRDAMLNILGVSWNMARIVAPLMPVGGAMVNISTIFSHTRYYGRTAYTVPKAALNALSQQLSAELGPRGIRVNAVCPGWVRTEAAIRSARALAARSGTPEIEVIRAVEAGQPLPGGLMEPADVTGPYLFLASDAARNITGQTLGIDRGEVPW